MSLTQPQSSFVPVIASIPHSGTFVPEELKSLYKKGVMDCLPSTDWYVDELYDFLPHLGVTVLKAEFSRYTADVNRPIGSSSQNDHSFHAHPILTRNSKGESLYRGDVVLDDIGASQRIMDYYVPYQDRLRQLLKQTVQTYGVAYLLDLHSFTYNIDAHICLGTDGAVSQSSAPTMHGIFNDQCKNIPLKVVSNRVFHGGHITRNTRTMDNVEAMQIEILKGCYLEQGHHMVSFPEKSQPNFDRLRNILFTMCERSIGQIRQRHFL